MNVPGLLIEYLITGSTAVLWLIPLLSKTQFQPVLNSLPSGIAPLLAIPFIYIIGLGLDTTSSFLIKWFGWQRKIRSRVRAEIKVQHGEIPDEDLAVIRIWLHSKELGREYELRSSRDRIARGAILNLALAAVVIPVFSYRVMTSVESLITFITLVTLSIAFYLIWVKCEKGSYAYKLLALLEISRSSSDQKQDD